MFHRELLVLLFPSSTCEEKKRKVAASGITKCVARNNSMTVVIKSNRLPNKWRFPAVILVDI